MFGYINICKDELKVKDYEKYKRFYCGFCSVLKKNYGFRGSSVLTYEFTFLSILLTSLYDRPLNCSKKRCTVNPFKKTGMITTDVMDYCSDFNIYFAYKKLEDDCNDEKKLKYRLGRSFYKKAAGKVKEKYRDKCEIIDKYLNELYLLEKENCDDYESIGHKFGKVTEEIFAYKDDIWEKYLRKIGYFLGKYIYLLDALCDVEKDIKKGSYNPLIKMHENSNFVEEIYEPLVIYMSEASRYYECLPCVDHKDILDNIFYAGVWKEYLKCKTEKGKEND